MPTRTFGLILLVLALALGGAACGGDDDDAASDEPATTAESEGGEGTTSEEGEGETLELAADPSGGLAFQETSLSAPAGAITIELTNESSTPHNVSIEGQTSDTIMGDSTSLKLDLQAGEYEFVCAVPGHAAAGMKGTLTVE